MLFTEIWLDCSESLLSHYDNLKTKTDNFSSSVDKKWQNIIIVTDRQLKNQRSGTFAAPAVSSTASLTNPSPVNVFSHWARAWTRTMLSPKGEGGVGKEIYMCKYNKTALVTCGWLSTLFSSSILTPWLASKQWRTANLTSPTICNLCRSRRS